jgi:hypothetical protein
MFIKIERLVNWNDKETVQVEYIQVQHIVSVRVGDSAYFIHTVDNRNIKTKAIPSELKAMLPDEGI